MATHEHITDRTTLVLARYKALQYARAAYRSANRRPPPMRQQQIDAQAFMDHPDVVAWAQRCAQIISDAPRRRR